MGLKNRNFDEQDIVFVVPGAQAADANLAAAFAKFQGFIKNIYAVLHAAGTTGTQTVDLNKNGTTVWTGSTKIAFATGSATPTYDAVSAANQLVAKGDKFSIDNDAVHSGTPGEMLTVHVRLSRKYPGAVTNLAPSALS